VVEEPIGLFQTGNFVVGTAGTASAGGALNSTTAFDTGRAHSRGAAYFYDSYHRQGEYEYPVAGYNYITMTESSNVSVTFYGAETNGVRAQLLG